MVSGIEIEVPDELEYLRRKKLLEEHFINHTCSVHSLNKEKARFAIQHHILILEPSLYDWEKEEWAKECISWAEGFNISSLTNKAEEIHISQDQTTIGRIIERMHFLEFKDKLIRSFF
ncbi:MAG: hypothetical protein NE334_16600 [Lentisphaeraceae bacterium]|nr:hypothetical protein [Lentisphaeraceae bacterium]